MAIDLAPGYLSRDEIDLIRLVRRLDSSINDGKWDDPVPITSWIRAQKTLQTIKYARSLLARVSLVGEHSTRFDGFVEKLDRVEEFATEVSERTEPAHVPPAPILPTIPRPVPIASPDPTSISPLPSSFSTSISTLSKEDEPPSATDNLIPDSSRPKDLPSETLIPSLTSTTSTSITTAVAERHLQNSHALQQDLSEQLAHMAAQLRRNATHFSETLAKDQSVVEQVQQKLESNFDAVQKERIRLRDHRGKSGSTTWLVFGIVAAVLVIFVMMMGLIRLT